MISKVDRFVCLARAWAVVAYAHFPSPVVFPGRWSESVAISAVHCHGPLREERLVELVDERNPVDVEEQMQEQAAELAQVS